MLSGHNQRWAESFDRELSGVMIGVRFGLAIAGHGVGVSRRWCTNRQPEETRCQRFLDLRVK